MMPNEEQKKQLASILETLCEELDISPSQYADARNKYSAVGDWLAEEQSVLVQFDPKIYPQGSIRLGTVVKPLGGDEYDVDLVSELRMPEQIDQKVLKSLVGYRLSQNEKYKKMLKEKARCWRLNYAGQFHMDIVPAIPDSGKGNGCILVPDRNLREWLGSNPKGYTEWFKQKMRTREIAMEEARAEVEDLPDHDLSIRTPLQRSVQILKRNRDIAFSHDKEDAPVSIVITTLAAQAYNHEVDLYDALTNIIHGMPERIEQMNGYPVVLNPTNKAENFAEKWKSNPRSYEKFMKWLQNLQRGLWMTFMERDMRKLRDKLSPMFGENLVVKGLVTYAEKIERERKKGTLKTAVGSGLLGFTGTTIRSNTFYGK